MKVALRLHSPEKQNKGFFQVMSGSRIIGTITEHEFNAPYGTERYWEYAAFFLKGACMDEKFSKKTIEEIMEVLQKEMDRIFSELILKPQ